MKHELLPAIGGTALLANKTLSAIAINLSRLELCTTPLHGTPEDDGAAGESFCTLRGRGRLRRVVGL